MSVQNIKDQFVVKDSGERHQFESGMVRDTQSGKLEWDRIFDGPMAERWATLLTKAITKYADVEPGKPNWTLASGDAERIRFRKSAVRHFMQWLRGDTDEDHGAAVFFNINGFEYVKLKQAMPTPIPDSEIKLEEKPITMNPTVWCSCGAALVRGACPLPKDIHSRCASEIDRRMCSHCNEFTTVNDFCIRCGNCNHCCTEL